MFVVVDLSYHAYLVLSSLKLAAGIHTLIGMGGKAIVN